MKVLILRFSSIGDIVLTTPVVRNLKKHDPSAEIHYATKDKFKGILEHNPYIHKLHLLGDNLSALLAALKKENFDVIIDLHHNTRTFIIKKYLGKKSFSFNKLNMRKWLLVQWKINRMPAVHIVDRYMDTLRFLQVPDDGLGLDYFIPATDEVDLQHLPATHRQGYVAFAIGAQHATKKLPKEKIAEICSRLHYPILLLGDNKDKETADWILQTLKNNTHIYNACGRYSLNQSASLVKQSAHVISHDTGLMHIAAALKKPIVSVWGNTVPAFGMYPYHTSYTIVENKGLYCRPCSKIGYEKCPKGHFRCMNDLEVDEIISFKKRLTGLKTENI